MPSVTTELLAVLLLADCAAAPPTAAEIATDDDTSSGIPVLHEIPIFGALFGQMHEGILLCRRQRVDAGA